MLAVDPGALYRGAEGFFFLIGSNIPPSARHATHGDVAMVHIRGPLEHHKGGPGDNYESILERLEAAFAGADVDGGGEPPKAVILCIDSVGGVVSGLNESIAKARRMRQAAGIPLIAYINEMAASAAYAWTTACDEVYAPASAITGSIGTISTMISVAEKDKADGIDVRLITSGARKADGHIHAPITDASIDAEAARVEELAESFFRMVSKARGLSVDKIRKLQAAIFLGPDAYARGLIDGVMSLDDVAMGASKSQSKSTKSKGNETKRRADSQGGVDSVAQRASISSVTAQHGPGAKPMSVALNALIATTEAALAAATSPLKRARLERDLAAYKFAAMKAEGGADDEDDEEEDEEDEDSKSAKAAEKAEKAKKTAEAAKHRAKAAEFKKKAAESEDAARAAEAEDDEEDDEEAEASLSPGQRASASPDVVDMAIADRLAALETERAEEKRMASIASALSEGRISPHEAKSLKGESTEVVNAVLKMRKGRIVHSEGGTVVLEPKGGPNGPTTAEAQITNEINERISQMGVTDPKLVERLRADMLENRRRAANGTLPDMVNGVPRY